MDMTAAGGRYNVYVCLPSSFQTEHLNPLFTMESQSVQTLLSKLTLEEKVSLLAAVDWWRTPVIKRDDVFVPHIKVGQRFPGQPHEICRNTDTFVR